MPFERKVVHRHTEFVFEAFDKKWDGRSMELNDVASFTVEYPLPETL